MSGHLAGQDRIPSTDPPFTSAHISQVEALPAAGTLLWRPLRRHLGIEAFGINAYVAREPGTPPTGAQVVGEDTSLQARMQEYVSAFGSNDVGALDELLAPEYVFTSSRGRVLNREEELAEMRSGVFRSDSATMSDVEVRRYGEAAVVTGRARLAGIWRTQRYDGDYRITAVWALTEGRWRLVAEHASRIGP